MATLQIKICCPGPLPPDDWARVTEVNGSAYSFVGWANVKFTAAPVSPGHGIVLGTRVERDAIWFNLRGKPTRRRRLHSDVEYRQCPKTYDVTSRHYRAADASRTVASSTKAALTSLLPRQDNRRFMTHI